jgi:hypothetical protein
MKTTVSAVGEVCGYLAVCLGGRTILHELDESDDVRLVGMAFVDGAIASTGCASLRGLFVLGDVQRGIQLNAFQEDPPSIAVIARDHHLALSRTVARSCTILPVKTVGSTTADGPEDALIIGADQVGNVSCHTFSPRHPQSGHEGQRLIMRGAVRLSSAVVKMERVVDRAWLGTHDGSVKIIRPIADRSFRSVSSFSAKASLALPLPGGMHPRIGQAFRPPFIPTAQITMSVPRSIVDLEAARHALTVSLNLAQSKSLTSQALVDWSSLRTDLSSLI